MLKSIVYSFLIGTYGTMIYRVGLDTETGVMHILERYEATNASYVMGDGNSIYSFSESGEDSKVYSFKDGVRSEVPCCGDNPCFITLSPDSKYLLTADYSGGSVSVYPAKSGIVGERVHKLSFEGNGPVTRRQASPHIHQVKFLPDIPSVEGKWILAPDLGSDKIRIIKYLPAAGSDGNRALDGNAGVLEHVSDIALPAGSGPRHIEFDVKRMMMYCICELSGKVAAYKISPTEGIPAFELVQSIVADEFNTGGSGDIHLHPSGNCLYTSHRLKNDGISVFKVSGDGSLEKTGYVPTHEHPRNFLITPCGEYMLVAAKNTCTLQLFKIGADGIPVATDSVLDLSPDAPTSVVLW